MRTSDRSGVCEHCQQPFIRKCYAANRPTPRFCSYKCRGEGTRKPLDQRKQSYEFRWIMVGHPLNYRDVLTKIPLHRLVLYNKIGPGPHPCHWCHKPVNWLPGKSTGSGALVADHLDQNKTNNAPDNLVPSCHGCNAYRDHPNKILDHEPFITDKKGYRHRAVVRICQHCHKLFQHLAAEARPNRGLFCSQKCARSK